MNNNERRDKGLAYIADEKVFEEMLKCRKLLFKLNHTDYDDIQKLSEITTSLLGQSENAFITPPFFCDYGSNIEVGKNFFLLK